MAGDPGASTTCTGDYTITAGPIDGTGRVVNTATAAGVSPLGQRITSDPDRATIAVEADIAATKKVSDRTSAVGDTVTFTFTVTVTVTVTANNNDPSPPPAW